jgi:hypothetical protein
MAKLGIITAVVAFFGLLATTQVAAAESITKQFGITASSVIALGWLGLLTLLAIAIILPVIRR